MKIKRRRKGTRYRGTRTHGRGHKNRTRGSGNQGGVGMSGTGKRGDQKKTLVIEWYGNTYFGKKAKGGGEREKKKMLSVSLRTILESLSQLEKDKLAINKSGHYEIDLKDYKIIGNDKPIIKLVIHAKAASKGAHEAVKHAGGEIIVSSS